MVNPGSKWKCNDPRSASRPHLEVIRVEGDYVICVCAQRQTKIALKYFGKTNQRGFTEVKQ